MQCSLLLLIHLYTYSTYTCQQKIRTRSKARSWKITTVKKLHEALQIDSNLVLIDLSVLPYTMYESRPRGGVQTHLPTRVTRSSCSLSTCLCCTEERKKNSRLFCRLTTHDRTDNACTVSTFPLSHTKP